MSSSAAQFQLAQEVLISQVYYPGGSAFRANVIALQCAFGLSLLLILASLALRFKNDQIWFVRYVRTSSGGGHFICPAPATWWLILSGIYVILVQPFLVITMRSAQPGVNLTNVSFYRTSIWVILYLAGWTIAWSTFLQPIISVTRPASDSRWNLARYPFAINTFFIVVPILYLFTNIYYSIQTNVHWNNIVTVYFQLSAALTAAAAEANPSISTLLNLESLAQLIKSEGQAAIDPLRKVWLCGAVFVSIEMVIFAVSSANYLSTLSRALASLPSQRSQTVLLSTYRSLVLTTIATLFIEALFLAVDFIILGTQTSTDTAFGQWLIVSTAWIFASLGTGVQFSMFLRSFPSSNAATSTLLPSAIHVKSQTGVVPSSSSNSHHPYSESAMVDRPTYYNDGGKFNVELSSLKSGDLESMKA